MKLIRNALAFAAILFLLPALSSGQSPEGAWKSPLKEGTAVLLVTPGYFSYTIYNEPEKSFILSFGGKWTGTDSGAELTIEFHTKEKEQVGKQYIEQASLVSGKLVTGSLGGGRQEWARLDEGKGALAGDWRISAREQNGKMNPIKPGARKTVKILSGSRFQWIAINTTTGEFFGTGGGTYTFKAGVYTEHIAFFSRDSTG